MCDGCLAHFYHGPLDPELTPRPQRIIPPRMPEPSFIETNPPATIEEAERRRQRSGVTFEPDAYVNALREAVEFLENEAAFWKDMFDTLALGIKVTATAH